MKEILSKTISRISNGMDTGKDITGTILKVGDPILMLIRDGVYIPIRRTNHDHRKEILGRVTRINGSKITVAIPYKKHEHNGCYTTVSAEFYRKEWSCSSEDLVKVSEEQMKNSTFLLSVDKAKVA